jgi:hypothetical protein
MMEFTAVEFNSENCEPTGKEYTYYVAANIEEAVNKCLYTHRLHNEGAELGSTGRIVHCWGSSFVMIPVRK